MVKYIKLSKEEYAVITFISDTAFKLFIPIPFLLLHPFNLFNKNVILLENLKTENNERLKILTEVGKNVALSKYFLYIIMQLILQIIFAIIIVCVIIL
jgi:hypothetical protein